MLAALAHRKLATVATSVALLVGLTAHAEEGLTLAKAWQLAARHHPQLAAAQAQVGASQAGVAVARLPYLPVATVDFSGAQTTANFVAKPGALPKDLARASAPTSMELWTFWQGGAAAQWTVTDFGKTAAEVAVAQALADAARADAAEVRRQLWLQVASSYAAAWLAQQRLGLAEQALQLAERRHTLVAQLVERNVRPASDAARALSERELAALTVDERRSELQAAQAGLAVAVGEPAVGALAGLPAPTDPPGAKAADLEAALEQLASRDPQLLGLEALRRAALSQVSAAERSQRPALYLAGGMALAGQQIASPTFNAQVAAGVTWQGSSLWSSGATASQARAKLPWIAAQQQAILRSKRQELAQAQAGVATALARRPLLQRAAQAAQASEAAAEQRYQSGVGLLSEVLDAAAVRVQVGERQLAAEQSWLLAETRWRAALGQFE